MDYRLLITIAILLLVVAICLLAGKPWQKPKLEGYERERRFMEIISAPFRTHYLYIANDGRKYPVFVSPTGHFYIRRKSASGKDYNYYMRNNAEKEYIEKFKKDYPNQTIFKD